MAPDQRVDDRGVSTAVTHVLAIGITTILISSLMMGTSAFLDQQKQDAARTELETIGNRIAAVASRTADSASGLDSRAQVTVDQPARVAGHYYTVRLEGGSECSGIDGPPGDSPDRCLVLEPSGGLNVAPVRVPVYVAGGVDLSLSSTSPGEVTVTAENDAAGGGSGASISCPPGQTCNLFTVSADGEIQSWDLTTESPLMTTVGEQLAEKGVDCGPANESCDGLEFAQSNGGTMYVVYEGADGSDYLVHWEPPCCNPGDDANTPVDYVVNFTDAVGDDVTINEIVGAGDPVHAFGDDGYLFDAPYPDAGAADPDVISPWSGSTRTQILPTAPVPGTVPTPDLISGAAGNVGTSENVVGTADGRVAKVNTGDSVVWSLPLDGGTPVEAVAADPRDSSGHNDYWYALTDTTLYKIDDDGPTASVVETTTLGDIEGSPTEMTVGAQVGGNYSLYVGTDDGFVHRFRADTLAADPAGWDPEYFDGGVTCLHFGPDKTIYAGGDGKVYRIVQDSGRIESTVSTSLSFNDCEGGVER